MNKYKKVSNSNTIIEGQNKNNLSAYWRETTLFLTKTLCISHVRWLLPPFGRVGVGFWLCVLALSPFGGVGGGLFAQNIGINTTGNPPNTKAILDINADAATKSGLLVPRMTTVERGTITAPIPESLLIFNTTTECFEAWNNTTSSWVAFGCIGGCSVLPTTANAGVDQTPACGTTIATLAGNTPAVGTGAWSVVSGTATITTPTSPTSGVTGLAASGTATLRWTISNNPCTPSTDDVVITTAACSVFPCGGTVIPIVDVTNPTTGKTWMDRNLGASQVATSSTDAAAYGDLYQWGRCSDGHEKRTSGTTATLSGSDTPGHGNFITIGAVPYDWRSPQNGALWQGVAGTNNPCPTGYRLPTEAELEAERLSWSTNNAAGAFGSPLKLAVAGYRYYSNATLNTVGSVGYYWSSTVSGTNARNLYFGSGGASMDTNGRAYGFSVRCIKD